METWAIVTLVIVLNIITVLSSYFLAKMQVSHSDKRLEKELARAREENCHQRRWEVRSFPLLKLRDELALMAFMQNRVNDLAEKQHTRYGEAKKKVTEELDEAIKEWEAYLTKGNLIQTLFIQYDSELFNKVNEIRENYIARYQLFNEAEKEEAIKSLGKIWPKVIEAQELINKKLEEL